MIPRKYPLAWPAGMARTAREDRVTGRYKVRFKDGSDQAIQELMQWGARKVVVNSNVPIRNDGKPYENMKPISDSGVALYWEKGGGIYCMACDRYQEPHANLQEIRRIHRLIRAIEKYASSTIIDLLYAGFRIQDVDTEDTDSEVPDRPRAPWWVVLNISYEAEEQEVIDKYRWESHHYRQIGDRVTELEVSIAYGEFLQERGLTF